MEFKVGEGVQPPHVPIHELLYHIHNHNYIVLHISDLNEACKCIPVKRIICMPSVYVRTSRSQEQETVNLTTDLGNSRKNAYIQEIDIYRSLLRIEN